MIIRNIKDIDLCKEFSFTHSRSSGPGGQHVNKVNTRIELRFNVPGSQLLTRQEKSLIELKLKSYLTGNGDLIISSQTERSQLRNKETAIKKFYFLIHEALKIPAIRKPTKPSYSSRIKKRKKRIMHSAKKQLRKKPEL